MYAKKFGVPVAKLMDKLWGESYFNPKTKKWAKTKDDDNVRAFNQYILDPIYKVFDRYQPHIQFGLSITWRSG